MDVAGNAVVEIAAGPRLVVALPMDAAPRFNMLANAKSAATATTSFVLAL